MVEETQAEFGEAVLIDCHSMPHEAIEAHTRPGQPRPDVVLGDRFGAAAGREVMDRVEAAFAGAGLRVARNAPFAGAYIAQAYGRPSRGGMWCRSRSTGRFTWTRPGSSRGRLCGVPGADGRGGGRDRR